jgi:hypothetical protein
MVRQYVFDNYIVPARQQQAETVNVRVGDVAKAVRMRGRIPQVYEALSRKKFTTQFGVNCVGRSGARNGKSTTFTFQI